MASPRRESIADIVRADRDAILAIGADGEVFDVAEKIGELEQQMYALAESLEFERAAAIRDQIMALQGKKTSTKGRRKKKRKAHRPRPGKMRRR